MANKREYKGVNFVDNSNGAAGGVWFMGFLGSAVYFVGLVDGFWNVILAVLKALVWPALLVHRIFQLLNI